MINIWAVLVCGVLSLLVGGLWYSPLLFGNRWQKEVGHSEEDMKKSNMPLIFITTFLLTVIMAVNLELFYGTEVGFSDGALYGFFTGLFWVSAALGVMNLFERRSFVFWLINAGYNVVMFTAMGAIIGAWQ